jgi:MYXO-CTERM domain-containing protein
MLRVLLTCVAVLAAGSLSAQESLDLNGSVPSDRRLTFLYEVDFGASSQSWTANINLTTNAAAGLAVTLIDVDGLAGSAQVNPDSIDSVFLPGAGTANATLNGSYAGVRCFAIEIETAQGSTASDYSGSFTISTGALSFVMQDQFVKSAPGVKLAVGKFAFWAGVVPAGTTHAGSLELDFGPFSQTRFFRFEGQGSNVQKIEFIDTTGGSANILATFLNPGAGQIASVPLTHSGRATLRINVVAEPGAPSDASWVVNAPCGVEMGLVGVPKGGSSDDCSTGETSGGLPLVAMLAALLVFVRARRANRKAAPAHG